MRKLTVGTCCQVFSVGREAHVQHGSCMSLQCSQKPIVGIVGFIRSFLQVRALWSFYVARLTRLTVDFV